MVAKPGVGALDGGGGDGIVKLEINTEPMFLLR